MGSFPLRYLKVGECPMANVDPIVLEVTQGMIVLITSLILYLVRKAARWVKSVNDRLTAIEQEMSKKE